MHVDGKVLRKTKFKVVPSRVVPPFSSQSLQKNTAVYPPPSCKKEQLKKRPNKNTFFRLYLERGDLPITRGPPPKREFKGKSLNWLVDPQKLDYCYYLPIFVDGLADSRAELRSLAFRSTMNLIEIGNTKVLPTIPQLIMPLKRALRTNEPEIIIYALKLIQEMVLKCPCVGQALVPYFRQLLPTCNFFRRKNLNIGDTVETEKAIGDIIEDTLGILETCGGPDAFINIKYMIPTYESCLLN